jgi:hypothetical protein
MHVAKPADGIWSSLTAAYFTDREGPRPLARLAHSEVDRLKRARGLLADDDPASDRGPCLSNRRFEIQSGIERRTPLDVHAIRRFLVRRRRVKLSGRGRARSVGILRDCSRVVPGRGACHSPAGLRLNLYHQSARREFPQYGEQVVKKIANLVVEESTSKAQHCLEMFPCAVFRLMVFSIAWASNPARSAAR